MSDHDSLYHRLFSHPLMVEQLVREFVPEAMAAGLVFARMKRVNVKFHGRRGRRREGDVIWQIPLQGGSDIFLCLLVEFQSQVDRWMAVRAQVYEGLLWQQLVAERKLTDGDKLPPVLLLVLYNGDQRWTAPTMVSELIMLPKESPLWLWQPQCRYHLLDMGAFPGDELARRDSLAALLFRLEQRHLPDELAGLIGEVIGWFRQHPGYDEVKLLFTELVRQAIEGFGAAVALPKDMMEMQGMLATLGESWKRQWLAEGRAEGRAEGKAEGKAELLMRLLALRFGAVAEDVSTRVHGADDASLDRWSERLLSAATIDAVFIPDH